MMIRHGNLLLRKIPKLPIDENTNKPANTKVVNNNHIIKNGKVFLITDGYNPFIIGYLIANDKTVLLHEEHGEPMRGSLFRRVKVPEGIYELRRQIEYTHEGMRKPMED